jgi:hypothetical protein
LRQNAAGNTQFTPDRSGQATRTAIGVAAALRGWGRLERTLFMYITWIREVITERDEGLSGQIFSSRLPS